MELLRFSFNAAEEAKEDVIRILHEFHEGGCGVQQYKLLVYWLRC